MCTVPRVLVPRSWRGSIRKFASEVQHGDVEAEAGHKRRLQRWGAHQMVAIRHLIIDERTKVLLWGKLLERTNLTRVKDPAESDWLAIQDSMKMLLTPIHVRVIEGEELSTVWRICRF
jgi:hypothetical protein